MNLPWITANQQTVAPAEQPDAAVKREFARLYSTMPPGQQSAYKALRMIFKTPDQESLCQRLSTAANPEGWLNDPIVQQELYDLSIKQADDTLPDKASVGRELMNIAQDVRLSVTERLKAYEQYSKLMGMIPGPNDAKFSPGATYIDQRRVFVLPPDDGSLNDWEKRAKEIRAKQIEMTANKDA